MDEKDCHLMLCLSDLYSWEWLELESFNTLVGRYVYLNIEKDYLMSKLGMDGARTLKQTLFNGAYTDRAIRLKLCELEQENLIVRIQNEVDKRGRVAQPTDKLIKLFESHIKYCKGQLEKKYLLLDK